MMKYRNVGTISLFLSIFVAVTPSFAQKVNYKTAKLTCTFIHHCYEGHSIQIDSSYKVDFSGCDVVKIPVTWDAGTSVFSFDNKERSILSKKLRRKYISINTKIGSSFVNFSTGSQSPTLRFRDGPKASSPITDMYNGKCKVIE